LSALLALLLVALLPLAGGWLAPAQAKGVTFIRDAEIESTIRMYSAPLFRAAGVAPGDVRIFLVQDRSLNAFVAGGQKLFLHTGFLMRTENASQVMGVIAHEAGHIAGGHLSRLQAQLKKSGNASLLAFLLGGAVAIGTGRGDAGAAIIAGGQAVATRGFLSYTRGEESAADQAAMRFLDATGQSSKGLFQFMHILEGQELLSPSRQDPYVRTHPLTSQRIDSVRRHLESSPHAAEAPPAEFEVAHRRMRAKLYGYINPPARTLRTYKEDDRSIEARYARAFAYYRKPDLQKALAAVDDLLAEQPDDPYFHELRGQVLLETRDLAAAVVAFRRAVDLQPKSPLLLTELGRVEVEMGDPAMLDAAVGHLKRALVEERDDAFTWRQLGIAHGKKGEIGHSALALAEEALLQERVNAALFQAGKAEKHFPRGSREWLQVQDLIAAANKGKKRQEKDNPQKKKRR